MKSMHANTIHANTCKHAHAKEVAAVSVKTLVCDALVSVPLT
jgi:hypothetical protein